MSRDNLKVTQNEEVKRQLESEDDDRRYIILFFIIALILLTFIVVGFSYSIFSSVIKGPARPICTQVVFNYSDIEHSDGGIHLTNASSIPDSVGKMLKGEKNTFDFSVSGKNNSKIPIKYYIVLEEDENSTLDGSNIKVYLTSRRGYMEFDIYREVPIISNLKEINVGGIKYRVLYEKTLQRGQKFSDDYTLRMWIKEDATDYYGKNYSLKVNVYTEGVVLNEK